MGAKYIIQLIWNVSDELSVQYVLKLYLHVMKNILKFQMHFAAFIGFKSLCMTALFEAFYT